ncbi:MAG: hypothetical protein LBS34_00330 [Rickettsiales bacterium]|jgi:hypothetical protein|nr:hypothetical protein [Rickettsiales bacterium]
MGDPKYLQIANRKIQAQNVSIQINGNDYPLTDVDDIAYTSPMNRTIIRGMGSTDTTGIETISGNDQPDTYTVTTKEIGIDLYNLLFNLWKKGGRLSLFYYDKEKKSSETIKNCCVQNSPKQANMGDSFYLTTITLGTFHGRD